MNQHKQPEPEINLQRLEQQILEASPQLLKGLDPGKKREVIKAIQIVSKVHSGPLPSPDSLAEYNNVIPNAAERIFNEFESQSKHRREMERRVIRSQIIQSYIGQSSALLIALTFLAAAIWCISNGHDVAGSIIGSVDLVALVTIFIQGKKSQKENLAEKKPKK